MAEQFTRFVDFSAGVMDPRMRNRVDLTAYYRSLQQARNVLIQPRAGLRRRPGSALIARVDEAVDADPQPGTATYTMPFNTAPPGDVGPAAPDLDRLSTSENGDLATNELGEWTVDSFTIVELNLQAPTNMDFLYWDVVGRGGNNSVGRLAIFVTDDNQLPLDQWEALLEDGTIKVPVFGDLIAQFDFNTTRAARLAQLNITRQYVRLVTTILGGDPTSTVDVWYMFKAGAPLPPPLGDDLDVPLAITSPVTSLPLPNGDTDFERYYNNEENISTLRSSQLITSPTEPAVISGDYVMYQVEWTNAQNITAMRIDGIMLEHFFTFPPDFSGLGEGSATYIFVEFFNDTSGEFEVVARIGSNAAGTQTLIWNQPVNWQRAETSIINTRILRLVLPDGTRIANFDTAAGNGALVRMTNFKVEGNAVLTASSGTFLGKRGGNALGLIDDEIKEIEPFVDTRILAITDPEASEGAQRQRIEPFIFNQDQVFVLILRPREFGVLKIDGATRAGITNSTFSGFIGSYKRPDGTDVQIPWKGDHLWGNAAKGIDPLDMAQSADTMVIVHPALGIFKIFRGENNTAWYMAELETVPPIVEFFDTQVDISDPNTALPTFVKREFVITFQGANVFLQDFVWSLIVVGEGRQALIAEGATEIAYSSQPFGTWDSTDVTGSPTGNAQTIQFAFIAAGFLDTQVNSISSTVFSLSLSMPANWNITGDTDSDKVTIAVTGGAVLAGELDDGTPIAGEPAWSEIRGWPASVTFHDGRMWFGGTRDKPITIFGSTLRNIFDFTLASEIEVEQVVSDSTAQATITETRKVLQVTDDDGIAVTLDTDQLNRIRYVVSGRRLGVFTTGGEAIVNKSGAAISPLDISIDFQTNHGTLKPRPISFDGGLFFADRGGRLIRRLVENEEEDSWIAPAVNPFASHIVNFPRQFAVAHGVQTSEGVEQDEASYMYVVNSDGTMAVMQGERWLTDSGGLQNLYSWMGPWDLESRSSEQLLQFGQSITGRGRFESVAVCGRTVLWSTIRRLGTINAVAAGFPETSERAWKRFLEEMDYDLAIDAAVGTNIPADCLGNISLPATDFSYAQGAVCTNVLKTGHIDGEATGAATTIFSQESLDERGFQQNTGKTGRQVLFLEAGTGGTGAGNAKVGTPLNQVAIGLSFHVLAETMPIMVPPGAQVDWDPMMRNRRAAKLFFDLGESGTFFVHSSAQPNVIKELGQGNTQVEDEPDFQSGMQEPISLIGYDRMTSIVFTQTTEEPVGRPVSEPLAIRGFTIDFDSGRT